MKSAAIWAYGFIFRLGIPGRVLGVTLLTLGGWNLERHREQDDSGKHRMRIGKNDLNHYSIHKYKPPFFCFPQAQYAQVTRSSTVRSFCFHAIHARSDSRRWMNDVNYRTWAPDDLFITTCRKYRALIKKKYRLGSKEKSAPLYGHQRNGIHEQFHTRRGVCCHRAPVCSAHGRKDYWTWRPVTAAIASSAECVVALNEENVDGSRFIDLYPGLRYPSDGYFVMDKISFHRLSIIWNSLRLRMQQTDSSSKESCSRKT